MGEKRNGLLMFCFVGEEQTIDKRSIIVPTTTNTTNHTKDNNDKKKKPKKKNQMKRKKAFFIYSGSTYRYKDSYKNIFSLNADNKGRRNIAVILVVTTQESRGIRLVKDTVGTTKKKKRKSEKIVDIFCIAKDELKK